MAGWVDDRRRRRRTFIVMFSGQWWERNGDGLRVWSDVGWGPVTSTLDVEP